MKFGKQLRSIVDYSYPEWQPNFMSYKELKKRIVHNRDGVSESSTCADDGESESTMATSTITTPNPLTAAEKLNESAEFFEFLQQEVDKVNDFFLEKQEDFVIEHQQLSSQVTDIVASESVTRSEVVQLRQQLIDFHAQLVILENYSTVNYTGFRKILKKHDKKTGLNVRSLALNKVSATPFFFSDTTRRLLVSTERQISQLDQAHKSRWANSNLDFGSTYFVEQSVPHYHGSQMTMTARRHTQAVQSATNPNPTVPPLSQPIKMEEDNDESMNDNETTKTHPVP